MLLILFLHPLRKQTRRKPKRINPYLQNSTASGLPRIHRHKIFERIKSDIKIRLDKLYQKIKKRAKYDRNDNDDVLSSPSCPDSDLEAQSILSHPTTTSRTSRPDNLGDVMFPSSNDLPNREMTDTDGTIGHADNITSVVKVISIGHT